MRFTRFPRHPSLRRLAFAPVVLLVLIATPAARAEDAAQWLSRVAQAARQMNYIGTIVYTRGGRVETSRIIHAYENGREFEKLMSLDGPPREVIRSANEVRFFYPDAKVVRVEPRTFRNAFPALSAEQQQSLAQYYDFRIKAGERVGGKAAEIAVFEPKDGMRYGHQFWSDMATGLLLKARVVNERGEVVEQFAFTDLAINAKIDRAMVEPSWPPEPPDWQIKQTTIGDVALHDTGWSASRASRPASPRSWRDSASCAAARSRSRILYSPTVWSPSACSSSRSPPRRPRPA